VVIAYNKLYLTSADFSNSYQAYFEKIVSGQTDHLDYIDVFGHKVLRALMPIPETLFPPERQIRIDFSSLSPEPRKHLVSGWSFSEPWGVWSEGANAKLEIEVPRAMQGDLRMIIAFHAFVTEQYPDKTIGIQVDMGPDDAVSFCFGQEYQTRAYVLSAERLVNKRSVLISFTISDPKSPKDLGVSIDSRRLGIGLRSIFFEELR